MKTSSWWVGGVARTCLVCTALIMVALGKPDHALAQQAAALAPQVQAPWGAAVSAPAQQYEAAKVVYDVAVNTPKALDSLLDRVSGLDAEYSHNPLDASVVVVLHGPELKFFDIRNFGQYEALVRRAQSLSVGTAIRFRVCQRSARNQGIAPEYLHGFLDLVPMADAEIVKLQQQGYAYMR